MANDKGTGARRSAVELSMRALVLGMATALAASSPAPVSAARESGPTFADWTVQLREAIDRADHTAWRPNFEALCKRHGLDASPELFRDFVRLQTIFEATRDGGSWRLRWAITNQEPSSKRIWQSWAKGSAQLASVPFSSASATAECDEISALTAFLAKKLDVRGVGLFWPTWNHTIAAWEPKPNVRILLPTTQIYLPCNDALDETTFDATRQKTIYEYTLKDVAAGSRMAPEVASFLVHQVDAYAGASLDLLALLRLHRGKRLSGSVQDCAAERLRLAGAVTLSARNEAALAHYFASELDMPKADGRAMLTALTR